MNNSITAFLVLTMSALTIQAQTSKELTDKECWEIFPRANIYQAQQAGDGSLYREVWHGGHEDETDELLGYVFLKALKNREKELELLIGIDDDGKIAKVKVRGKEAIDEQFLSQFKGRNLQSGFEIAGTPDDLLHVPAKLKAVKSDFQLSENIAKAVHGALQSAVRLLGPGNENVASQAQL
jgi:hypothetical protein